ncbi:hypothetical protein Sjap_013747 [Stephania japonica]|uniref:Uncharacterized protein n=1 Tax=Stephania japonica TaxID=461633 RepID=A0AAP0IZA1_9MAGN
MEMDVENNTYKKSLVSVKKIRFMENLRLQEGDVMITEDDLGPITVSQRLHGLMRDQLENAVVVKLIGKSLTYGNESNKGEGILKIPKNQGIVFKSQKETKRSIGGNKGKSVKGKVNNGEVNLTQQQYGKNSTQFFIGGYQSAQFKSNAINEPLKVPIGRSLGYSHEAMNISIEALEVGKKRFQTGKGPRAKGFLMEVQVMKGLKHRMANPVRWKCLLKLRIKRCPNLGDL